MLAFERIVPHFGAAREARVRLAGLFRAALRNKRDTLGALIGIGAVAAIVTNGLFMQSGPHPAPIFAVKPPPVIFRDATGAIAQLPRPRPVVAQRPEPLPRAEPVPLPRPRAQGAPPASRADPIADIINPARQLSALQRVLNEFGYGPIKVTGTFDAETGKGIERFERDHNLTVTGQNSPRLRQALGLATGLPLD